MGVNYIQKRSEKSKRAHKTKITSRASVLVYQRIDHNQGTRIWIWSVLQPTGIPVHCTCSIPKWV